VSDQTIAPPDLQSRVSVAPDQFTFVKYDAVEIAEVVADLAAKIGLANPIRVVVDELILFVSTSLIKQELWIL
jgi:hypothetical protein